MFAFLHLKANSMEICEKYPFLLFSAFLLRFKTNYLEKMDLWIPIALAKIYFFSRGPTLAEKSLNLVGTVLKIIYSYKELIENLKGRIIIPWSEMGQQTAQSKMVY